ncbi:galactose-specific lectin nattectin-like [Nematolebias whitei]|uniref:galactose-specific lectin nattectin-like n=1 Tax=Nematolebias whitei TaxID=451745 RepID=UPI0018999A4E|nr:galactose-specific lectin nattectin-like [Nematolebias whitei]
MMLFLSLLVLALAAASPSDGQELKLQRGDCPMYWFSFGGRCYKYFAARLTWADAEFQCLSEGANLVSIHSEEDLNFVVSLVQNFDPTREWTWIGLNDMHKEGGWIWTDGSMFNFSRWDIGQPDNLDEEEHCGHITFVDHVNWNDYSCSFESPFVCLLRKVCP